MIEALTTFANELWTVLRDMSPYLLFGFFVAGVLSVFISAAFVERHLGGRGLWPVVKATVLGIPLPLCSCGVIPVAASLRRHKATRAATTSFLISTPETGVDSILVTYSLLGPVFAVFRPLAALVNGILGGLAVNTFVGHDETTADSEPACEDTCCERRPSRPRWRRALHHGFVTLPRDIAGSLIIGLIIAAAIAAIVPDDFFAQYLSNRWLAMIVMMLAGIPTYICATASVPIAAALIAKGVPPGAALVFLIAGPATNAATVATIWKIMGQRTAVIYLVTVALTALASGLALDTIFSLSTITATAHHAHEVLPPAAKITSALVLLALLAYTLRPRAKPLVPP